ncbi:MAG: hypothetical protein WC356_05075 [Candidatus Micrarchaeia archaeon]|jgi:hypothetical protein
MSKRFVNENPPKTVGSLCAAFNDADGSYGETVNAYMIDAISEDEIVEEYVANVRQAGRQFQITLYLGGRPILAIFAPAQKPVIGSIGG